jgi:hypothetical protein
VIKIGTRDLNDTERNFPLETVEISYSTDGNAYTKAGEMEAVPGRWVGAKCGVFCTSDNKESKGYALVEAIILI